MIRLDGATVLLQWATGGLAFLWVTSRRREVGVGYGWLLRGVFGAMAAGAVVAATSLPANGLRDACAALTAAAAGGALVVSVVRRRAGVAGERARTDRRAARVASMTGAHRSRTAKAPARQNWRAGALAEGSAREFPPALDLLAPAIGMVGLIAAASDAGGPGALAVVRTLVGAAFLGAVTDAMLLGHWYLVQPGLGRAPLLELVRWTAGMWPLEVAALAWPPGMARVLTGGIDDGWHGTLGWFWAACAVATIVLTAVTRAALRERAYSAVMAATGLLYLAILTAFGTDLVARVVLAP